MWVMIVAVICLTVLELYAMKMGLDGYLFSIIVMGIAGIAGFKMPGIVKHFRKK